MTAIALENWIAVLGGRDSVMLSAKTHHSSTPLEAGCVPRLKTRMLPFSVNGGVLVSTEGLRTGSHAEDDSLASLKIESKK